MWTICMERVETDEVVNISDYGFEWYQGHTLVRSGLVENKEDVIMILEELGFVIIE